MRPETRIIRKSIIHLITVVLLALTVPVGTVNAAGGTTIEINNGTIIEIESSATIIAAADGSSGIPVTVKNIPDLGIPDHGFAVFDIDITWDPSTIHFDSVITSTAAKIDGWNVVAGEPGETGTFRIIGWNISNYITDDIVLLYLGITICGNPGDSTEIGVTVTTFGDDSSNDIPVTPVSSTVRITGENYISFTPSSVTIPAGENLQFNARLNRSNGSSEDITQTATWSSTNALVATVQPGGLATGVTEGITTIVAAYGGIRGSVVLNVTGNTPTVEDTAEPPPETTNTPAPDEDIDQPPPIEETDETSGNGDIDESAATDPSTDSDTIPIDEKEPEKSTADDEKQPAATDDTDSDSSFPVVWIVIGGVAVVGVVLVILWFSFFARRRY